MVYDEHSLLIPCFILREHKRLRPHNLRPTRTVGRSSLVFSLSGGGNFRRETKN